MSIKFDFIIVGGGIVGLATAYKLQLKFPDKLVAVLEKESELARHQTGRNSGVIHSGIYYSPGSYKAENCKRGAKQLVNFAKKMNIPHDICGKLIVAVNEAELPALDAIFEKGKINGTKGICFLNAEEIRKKEPYIKGLKAIWVPTAGIIDFVAVSRAFANEITSTNPLSRVISGAHVKATSKDRNTVYLKTPDTTYEAGKVIYCTGLFSDRIAERDNVKDDMRIVGFRGDYFELVPEARHKIKNLVYPVPDSKFPFLGVHFTRMIQGGVECGPNAVFTFKREGYKRTSFSLKDTFEALSYKGTWKLFRRHWKKGIEEYQRAFSKIRFVKTLRQMMPDLKMEDIQYCRAGVRAQAIDGNGHLVDDFKIVEKDLAIHVLNAPSPAATACLSIADEIVSRVK